MRWAAFSLHDAEGGGQALGANLFETDQADAGDGRAGVQLWGKACWQLGLHDGRVNPKVDKDAAPNDSLNDRQLHAATLRLMCRATGSADDSRLRGWEGVRAGDPRAARHAGNAASERPACRGQ